MGLPLPALCLIVTSLVALIGGDNARIFEEEVW